MRGMQYFTFRFGIKFVIGFIICFALIVNFSVQADHNSFSNNSVFPNGFIESTDGTQTTIREKISENGNYSIIVVWAVWCPFCSKELVRLDTLAANNNSLKWIGINLDDEKAAVLRYKKKWQIAKPLHFKSKKQREHEKNSNSTLADILQVSNLPAIFIVNSQAEIVFFKEGWQPESEDSEYSNWIKKISK